MRYKTKFLVLPFISLLAFATSTQAQEYQKLEITFSHNQPLNSPEHAGAAKFKKVVEAESNGAVIINIYPASQLGGLREQIESTQFGEIDITLQPPAFVTPFVDDVKVIDLPYLFPPNNEKTYAVLDSKAGDMVLKTLEKGGFEGLGIWPGGFKLMTNNKREIHSPDDLKGLSVRTMQSPLLIEQYKIWGANAIPMAYAEVYNALQQNVVDGQENPLQTIYLNNYHEVQKYITESYHGIMSYLLMANKPWFDGLPEATQDLLRRAEKEGRAASRKAFAEMEDDFREKIIASGINYQKLTDEEVAKFREVTTPLYRQVYNEPHQIEILEAFEEELKKVTAD